MHKSVLVIFFIALWQRQESRLYEWFCTNNSVPTEHWEVWILHMQKDWQLQITYFWYCLCLTVFKTFEAEGEEKRKENAYKKKLARSVADLLAMKGNCFICCLHVFSFYSFSVLKTSASSPQTTEALLCKQRKPLLPKPRKKVDSKPSTEFQKYPNKNIPADR